MVVTIDTNKHVHKPTVRARRGGRSTGGGGGVMGKKVERKVEPSIPMGVGGT